MKKFLFRLRIRTWIAGLAAVGLLASHALALEPITPLEAIHLVERRVPGVATREIDLDTRLDRQVYWYRGRLGEKRIEALVDARVARVLWVKHGGRKKYEWSGITVVGHRGTVKFAPENTIAAFDKAIDLGVDLLEMDVRQTADGHLVIMHDATVDRTTDGKGPIAAMTLEEVKRLDAGSWFGREFKGEPVPTLAEALAAIEGMALPDIDFKAGDPEKLVALLEEAGLLGKVTLYCGSWDLMKRTLAVNADFKIRPTVPVGHIGLPRLIAELDPPIVNIDWHQFTERLVRDVHLSGRLAFVNTMGANDNEFGLRTAIEAGADYLQSDRLDLVLKMLRKRGLHE